MNSPLQRTVVFLYGVASYLVFLATFLYAIGFIGNFGVPQPLDGAPSPLPWPTALAIDLALLSVFAVQHSVMARPFFKRALTCIVPPAAERSTYVLASSLALALLFWQWQPLGGAIWSVETPAVRALIYAAYGLGWALILLASFAINHFDLFGLRQSWRAFQGLPQSKLRFTTPLLYRLVRHPLYVGWLFVFWSTPAMTASHLLFAMMTTGYILVAIQLEEADLMREHPEYAAYRRRVPMLIPRIAPPPAETSGAAASASPLAGD